MTVNLNFNLTASQMNSSAKVNSVEDALDEVNHFASSWGIGGRWKKPYCVSTTQYTVLDNVSYLSSTWEIDYKYMKRERKSSRNPALLAISQALGTYTQENPEHGIHNAREMIDAFKKAHEELDQPKKLLQDIQSGKLVVIRSGHYDGPFVHVMIPFFYQGYLGICSRWYGDEVTMIYKVDLNKVTEEVLAMITKMRSSEKEEAVRFFYKTLPQTLGHTDDKVCQAFNEEPLQKIQKGSFCFYDSPEAAVFNIIALQIILFSKNREDIPKLIQQAKKIYKDCTTFFRLHFGEKYIEKIRNKNYLDYELLEIICDRLKGNWHPERFHSEYFQTFKTKMIERIDAILYRGPCIVM